MMAAALDDTAAVPVPAVEIPTADEQHDEWPALLVLAHVRMAALIRELHELQDEIEQVTAEYCDRCGSRPCRNPSFCNACRRADQEAKTQPRRVVERRPTPQTTIEAIMYCVRERGLAALKEPANVERLSRCDAAAKAEINRRIARIRT